MSEYEESELIEKGPCDKCGSSDACALYTDGHSHCYSCDTTFPAAGTTRTRTESRAAPADLINGEYLDLRTRKLTQDTCRFWGYECSTFNRQPVQIANYKTPDGHKVSQKLRFADKSDMPWLGDKKAGASLYGQWLWRNGGRQVVVTEGELDAMSLSQCYSHKWPVVSVSGGAAGAHKDIEKGIEFLSKFERVVFMYDNDEAGRTAALRCAAILEPGKAFIASLPLKDASDMLVAGRAKELTDAAWGAKEFRPDGIVSIADVKAQALQPRVMGHRWFDPEMTEATYGMSETQLILIGAATGAGKTDFITQQIAFQINDLPPEERHPIGALFLESEPAELLQRIAGKHAGKTFHQPDGSWTAEELGTAIETIEGGAPLHLYDSFGATDWATVKSVMLHMIVGLKCKFIYLDHLTALAAMEEDVKKALDMMMAELAGMAKQHRVIIIAVSHLATPDGKPHEEGGRVTIRHFIGSRAIGFWSHVMLGIERNQQDEDEFERTVNTVRVLKARGAAKGVGKTFRFAYDYTTGLLSPAPPKDEAASYGFKPVAAPSTSEDF